jgi:hypothetical protein
VQKEERVAAEGCPVSKALAGVESIELDAQLVG